MMTIDQSVQLAEIAAAIPVAEIKKDLEGIGRKGPITSQGNLDVYLASAGEIPNVLLEIGRLQKLPIGRSEKDRENREIWIGMTSNICIFFFGIVRMRKLPGDIVWVARM